MMSKNCNSLQIRRQRTQPSTQQSKSPRIRSASVGRSRDYDLRRRYWAFLFDNLHRAVDEIYQNCEKDESIVECKEAIMVLDNYTREFQALIQWLNLNINYESTPPPNRPNSLAWEIRKSMPKQMTYWNTFFNRNSEVNNVNAINKTSDLNPIDVKSNEEKENLKNSQKSAEVIIENKVLEPKSDVLPHKENGTIDENNIIVNKKDTILEVVDSEKKSEKNPLKVDMKSCVSNTNLVNTAITSSKPLNPLARSFKSRINATPTTATSLSTTSTTPSISQTVTIKKVVTIPKSVASVVANGVSQTATIKKTIASTPDLSANNKELIEVKKTEHKISVSLINKNFIKDTNSSRAKNVKNIQNNTLMKSKSTNVLSTRNSKENVKLNNNLNISKTKKVKDADGWELVRGRQRYKASPPKVIIVEDESVIKTTADGTVIAVTAASQTNDDWEPLAPGMCSSWSNQSDTDLLRTPGRALQMHEKFSSPSRKRSLSETIKRSEEKLAKAQEAREKFLEKKAQKFKGIVKKVEEMKAWKEEQQLQLRISMEMKLQRAEEKRQQQLEAKVRKAHDEESKVNEILFINTLEAQNKKYDILSKEKDHELRLQDLHEERLRKLEEKAAKEAAAEERRKTLEEERQARIVELQERRKRKDLKIEQQLQEKEKERIEIATQKELDRRSRISAVNALYAANIEELQKKIQFKQCESKRRHEENMEQIRQKALELSVKKSSLVGNDEAPVCMPYDTMKMCSLCKVIIKSEVFLFGHLRGKKHNDAICEQNEGRVPTNEELENYNLKHIIEAPKQSEMDMKAIQNCDNEKLKTARKRCKKLKQRLINKANQYETHWNEKLCDAKTIPNFNKIKIGKMFKELNVLSADTQITGQWPTNMVQSLERVVNELEKIFKANSNDSLYFYSINGISLITKLLSRILSGNKERPTSLTDRANAKLTNIYEIICKQHFDISDYVLQSNNMIQLLDILFHRINLLDTNLMSSSCTSVIVSFDGVIGALCRLLSSVFNSLYSHYSTIVDNTDDCLAFNQRIQEVISYIVSIGMIDKLSLFMSNIRGPIDEMPELANNLQYIISLFTSITKLMTLRYETKFGTKIPEDETQFMMTLRMTHICGVVSLIYGMLLHSGAPVRGDNVPPIAPKHTIELTLEAIQFLNHVSLLDLTMIQSILGGEGLSLQLRHICSYLIWYCSHNKSTQLLHEVILLIGNFVALNNENQTLIQSGQRPTVVQQLCSLPFEYFCDEKLSRVLFPTLIACCFNNSDNRNILEQEMSTLMLSTFIESTIVNLQLKAVDSEFMSQTNRTLAQERWTFAVRFPKNRWNEAKDYFESQTNQSIESN